MAKRTPFESYSAQNRNGMGRFYVPHDDKTVRVVRVLEVQQTDEIIVATNTGQVLRANASEIKIIKGRRAKGVIFKKCEKGEFIVDVTRLAQDIETKLDDEVSSEIDGAASDSSTNPETNNETE